MVFSGGALTDWCKIAKRKKKLNPSYFRSWGVVLFQNHRELTIIFLYLTLVASSYLITVWSNRGSF